MVKRLVTFKKKTPCAGEFSPVVERLIIFEKIPVLGIFPCTGEIDFFRVKIPVLGIFWRPLALKKTLILSSFELSNHSYGFWQKRGQGLMKSSAKII